jgi:hypothetical protein
MIIEFIQSYIWFPKNASQVGAGCVKEKANPEVIILWLFLWYWNFDIASIFENDANNNAFKISFGTKTSNGKIVGELIK